jgi:hypothetical protein
MSGTVLRVPHIISQSLITPKVKHYYYCYDGYFTHEAFEAEKV